MKIYIDNDCMCHVVNDGTMREFDVPDFDDKCVTYIEGCRYIPNGESWTREDNIVFQGEMISPCIDSRVRDAYQAQYEADAAEREALEILIGKEAV